MKKNLVYYAPISMYETILLRGKDQPDRMLAKPWRRLFLAAYTLWAKPGCCCCTA